MSYMAVVPLFHEQLFSFGGNIDSFFWTYNPSSGEVVQYVCVRFILRHLRQFYAGQLTIKTNLQRRLECRLIRQVCLVTVNQCAVRIYFVKSERFVCPLLKNVTALFNVALKRQPLQQIGDLRRSCIVNDGAAEFRIRTIAPTLQHHRHISRQDAAFRIVRQ